jgi:hypothetical protein
VRHAAPRSLVAAAAVVLAAACGSSTEPTAPVSNDPAFTVSARGDVSTSLAGIPFSLIATNGYSESVNGGASQATSVVMITFGGSTLGPVSFNVGLMGPLSTGVYNVRVIGSSALGSKQELYGSITVNGADGSRTSYSATSGTVTLTSVGTTLRGTFSLHYGRVVVFPANPTQGTSYPSTPASVDATGSFVVLTPTLVIP